jgi:spore germination protein Q
MNYNPLNYPVNGQSYYSFPAYRSFVGGTNPGSGLGVSGPGPGMTGPGPGAATTGPSAMPGSYPQQMYPQQMAPSGAPTATAPTQAGPSTQPAAPSTPGLLPVEQSYIENILRLNLGKTGTFYMTYENNSQWNAKVFKGRIEAAGRDHIIISDTKTGMRFLLLMVNLDYVTFDEPLNYTYPYQQGTR